MPHAQICYTGKSLQLMCGSLSHQAPVPVSSLRSDGRRLIATYSTLLIAPPSTWTVAPVMYAAPSDRRNAPTRPNSSILP